MMELDKEKMVNDEKDLLNIVYAQISSFDSKAGILISIIGIMFGLSFSFLDVLDKIRLLNTIDVEALKQRYYVFGVIYVFSVVSAMLCILFSILVVVPRKHKQEKININYYDDVKDMNYKAFSNNYAKLRSNGEYLFGQIKTNSNICAKKHKFLKLSIWFLIPYSLTLLSLIVLAVFLLI